MSVFQYLIDKIQHTGFREVPFRHVYIEDFFTAEHFDVIRRDSQLDLPRVSSTEDLINMLQRQHYSPEPFPGCTTNIDHYLTWYHGDRHERFESDLLEGFGIAFRLRQYTSDFIRSLVQFLNSPDFHHVIKLKFHRTGRTRVETAIQKYLSGYEISPHPDIRKKCLTYMININPSDLTQELDTHTHLLKFNDEHAHVYDFWREHTDTDRCWVPWSWCETLWTHTQNNSILMFAPDDDTLHAVKLDYDHLVTQRTQIYGNLWYGKGSGRVTQRGDWRRLPHA